jgi:hypothetical protein
MEEDLCDEQSILYEILQYIIKVIEVKNKELNYSSLKFSSKSLKYIFGDKLKDETFKLRVVQSIKKLLNSSYLTSDKEFIYITEKALTNFYSVG